MPRHVKGMLHADGMTRGGWEEHLESEEEDRREERGKELQHLPRGRQDDTW